MQTESAIYGQSYMICAECGRAFTMDLEKAKEEDPDDVWCEPCIEAGDPPEYDHRSGQFLDDYDYNFADPGGESALRAEIGVRDGKCTKCEQTLDLTDEFCRKCGQMLDQRNIPCPDCGRENMLTKQDKSLHYCCDYCADEKEKGY